MISKPQIGSHTTYSKAHHIRPRADNVASTVMEKLIVSEHLDALQSFISAWDSWYLLDIHPLRFAVDSCKFANLKLLRDDAVERTQHSNLPNYLDSIIPMEVECDLDLKRKGLIAWEDAGQHMSAVFQAAIYLDMDVIEELLQRDAQNIPGHLLYSAYIYFEKPNQQEKSNTNQDQRIVEKLVRKGAHWHQNF
ncbi:hypothetical protein EKO04_001368 [Ascochyta lentis]|uniref:Uncharacterized protein n=1 Tax=Ascochyta lentis TaxID=205686 RepID=A0A8H7MKW4_9PLEO|nr:hypothetical protein EKO04_001368 [Ascochyta lentis]